MKPIVFLIWNINKILLESISSVEHVYKNETNDGNNIGINEKSWKKIEYVLRAPRYRLWRTICTHNTLTAIYHSHGIYRACATKSIISLFTLVTLLFRFVVMATYDFIVNCHRRALLFDVTTSILWKHH